MEIAQILRNAGYKVTPQRLAIYNTLCALANHPTAEMIYQDLKDLHPSMSLATVYKTMDIFSKMNLVRILNFGEDFNRYDHNVVSHAHIQCGMCHKIMDLFDVDVSDLERKTEAQSGFHVTGFDIAFQGICPHCLMEYKKSHTS